MADPFAKFQTQRTNSSADPFAKFNKSSSSKKNTIFPGSNIEGIEIVNIPATKEKVGAETSARESAQKGVEKAFDVTQAGEIVSRLPESLESTFQDMSAKDFISRMGSVDNAESFVKLATDIEKLKDAYSTKKALGDGVNLLLLQANNIPYKKGALESWGQSAENVYKDYTRQMPDRSGFRDTVNLLRSLLTRASGQVGVLTEQDVKAVLPAIEKLGSAFEADRDQSKRTLAIFLKGKYGEAFVPEELKPFLKISKQQKAQTVETMSTEELLKQLGQ